MQAPPTPSFSSMAALSSLLDPPRPPKPLELRASKEGGRDKVRGRTGALPGRHAALPAWGEAGQHLPPPSNRRSTSPPALSNRRSTSPPPPSQPPPHPNTHLSGFSPRISILSRLIFSAGSTSPVLVPSRRAASTSSRITGTTAEGGRGGGGEGARRGRCGAGGPAAWRAVRDERLRWNEHLGPRPLGQSKWPSHGGEGGGVGNSPGLPRSPQQWPLESAAFRTRGAGRPSTSTPGSTPQRWRPQRT